MRATVQKNISNIINSAKEVFKIEADSILKLIERTDESFAEAINIILECKGRVIITGMGKSGLVGKKIAATLSSTGTPSYFLHPAESTHGDSGIITRDDVVLAISNSGETAELMQLLPLVKRFGIKLIAMTGKMDSTLAQRGDVVLDISVEKEACPLGLAPTASTTVTLAMGDALAVCLLEQRGFTPEDFLLFHPSGALGKGILYKVEDLMIKEYDKLPIVNENELFTEAIVHITEKGLGMAVIVSDEGKTTGLLSDGDIRRSLLKTQNVSGLIVKDVMTKNPKSIQKNDLAAKALQLMEKYSITSLIVNKEDGSPESIVHIHNLLKAGIA